MNASSASSHSDFVSIVEAELGALEEFSLMLETEQLTLKNSEIDRLPEIARSKSELLVKLSQLGASRDAYLNRHGIAADPASISQFIGADNSKSPLLKTWEKLLTSAKRAQELNQLNGAMIEALLKNNQQALAILQDVAQQHGLYGPDGHSRAIGSGRTLGKS